MEDTKFAIFRNKEEEIARAIRLAGLDVDTEGNLLSKGRLVSCECCSEPIKKQKLGSIMRNSPAHVFCDNPICFVTFVRKYKMR